MKKQVVYMSLILFSLFHTGMAAEKPWEKLGRIAEFQVIDTRGEERNVQVFIPHNINYETPAKVVWYFRGTNGIYLTWNIETTRLYRTGHDEKAIIVAPDLSQKLWSRGSDNTDYYLVKGIIERLKTLEDNNHRVLTLDLENMLAIGFSAGGGFIFHLAGRYPLIFNEIPFVKYIDHARNLYVTLEEDGSFTGDEFDVQAVRDLIAAYQIFPEKKPPFFVSVGDADDVGGNLHIENMKKTRELLGTLGFMSTFYLVPGLHHRFIVDFTAEFYKTVNDFLFPVRITAPQENSEWRRLPGKEFSIKWTSVLPHDRAMNIDLYSLTEKKYIEIAHDISDSGSYTTTFANLLLQTGRYFLRITTDNNMDTAYSGPFKMIFIPLTLTLQLNLKEEKAWIIRRYYCDIHLSVEHLAESGPVAKIVIYRRELSGQYLPVKEIPVEELQNNTYSFSDKYLKNRETYSYKAEACDTNGTLLAVSPETNLLVYHATPPVKDSRLSPGPTTGKVEKK